jgi:hypothetical protein
MARLERLEIDDGRRAIRSASSMMRSSQDWLENADHACQAAGPSILPTVSSRHVSSHSLRSAPLDTSPARVPASRPSEYAKAPIGNKLSQRWRREVINADGR